MNNKEHDESLKLSINLMSEYLFEIVINPKKAS